MSICDIAFEMTEFLQFLGVDVHGSIHYNVSHIHNYKCVLEACIQQFFVVASPTWNFILAITLLRIMYFQVTLEKIEDTMWKNHVFVWTIALIATIIPFGFDGYGYVPNSNGAFFQCWISKSKFQLCLYGPVIIYLLFSLCLMLYCVYKGCRFDEKYNSAANNNVGLTESPLHTRRISSSPNKLTRLNMQIVYFTIVFVLAWSGPVVNRMMTIIKPSESVPDWIVWWHDIGITSIGLSNAAIWMKSNLWNTYNFYQNKTTDSQIIKRDKLSYTQVSKETPTVNVSPKHDIVRGASGYPDSGMVTTVADHLRIRDCDGEIPRINSHGDF